MIFKLKQFFFKYFIYPLARLYWKILNPRTVGSRALLLFEDKILLVKNLNLPYWTMPGGGVARGETPQQCLKREIWEELAVSIENTEYELGTYRSSKEGKRDEIHVFVVRLLSAKFEKQWELADAKWFPLNELPTDMSPATVGRIKEYENGVKNIEAVW